MSFTWPTMLPKWPLNLSFNVLLFDTVHALDWRTEQLFWNSFWADRLQTCCDSFSVCSETNVTQVTAINSKMVAGHF